MNAAVATLVWSLTTVICTNRPLGLHSRASLPDNTRIQFGQFAAHVAHLSKLGGGVDALASRHAGTSARASAWVVDRCIAWRSPRVPSSPVILRERDGVTVDGAVEGVVVGGFHAAATSVLCIRIGAARGTAVRFGAADTGAHGKPEAGG